jgi:transcriptional regulator with XRE-family HTH domain
MRVMARIPTFTLADRLKKARVTAGITRDEMAKRLSVTASAISNWENEIRPVHPLFVRAWAEATDVDLVWLEGDDRPYRRRRAVRGNVSLRTRSTAVPAG